MTDVVAALRANCGCGITDLIVERDRALAALRTVDTRVGHFAGRPTLPDGSYLNLLIEIATTVRVALRETGDAGA